MVHYSNSSLGGALKSPGKNGLFCIDFRQSRNLIVPVVYSRSTCDKCTRSTPAVKAAAAGALGADRKRVVHGDDDSGPKSAEIDDVERKTQLTGLRILDFLGSFD